MSFVKEENGSMLDLWAERCHSPAGFDEVLVQEKTKLAKLALIEWKIAKQYNHELEKRKVCARESMLAYQKLKSLEHASIEIVHAGAYRKCVCEYVFIALALSKN